MAARPKAARRRGSSSRGGRQRPWTGAAAGKELSRRYRQTPRWRYAEGQRAPRLGPNESIGRGMARSGIFVTRDPMVAPRLWSRWHWLGLLGWAAVTGGSLWRAWRAHEGPASGE